MFSTSPSPVKPEAAAALSLKQRLLVKEKSTADVELIVVEPESSPTPVSKKLESIPKSRRPSTFISKSQQKVIAPKRRRTDIKLMYESEDDVPPMIRTNVISSSSSGVESEELHEK
uniref:Uncharacterized protein n=1 Tax=Trichogramma kaykai TaxID=54128 RepID=A0ABD2WN76_9HYME